MAVTKVSPPGRAFIRSHEGNPLTCYLDPVGVPTIGTGFTMRSASVRRELAKLGITKLVPGKTKLTAAQSDAVFAAVLDTEFAPAVVAKSPADRKQHQFDAGTSVVFNLGVGAMGWQWAELWRAGKLKAAAEYLASHYNTAQGKKLAGLVRRRKEEARLFLTGDYGNGGAAVKEATEKPPKSPDPVVKEAQEILSARGFDPGAIDGWMGAALPGAEDMTSESVAENLSRRHVDVGRYSVHVDEPEGVATFMLYDLSGAVVGYQQYRPAADKKKKNHPREGRYYTYKSPARLAVFGLETWAAPGPLFIVEGIFDCVRLHNLGLAAIATLSNDPKGLRGWLFATSRPVLAICDSGDGGRRLAKFGSRHVVCGDKDLGDMTDDEVADTINQLI